MITIDQTLSIKTLINSYSGGWRAGTVFIYGKFPNKLVRVMSDDYLLSDHKKSDIKQRYCFPLSTLS